MWKVMTMTRCCELSSTPREHLHHKKQAAQKLPITAQVPLWNPKNDNNAAFSREKQHCSSDFQNDNNPALQEEKPPFPSNPPPTRPFKHQVTVVVGDVAIGEAIHKDAIEDLARVKICRQIYQRHHRNSKLVLYPKACQILSDLQYITIPRKKIENTSENPIPSHKRKSVDSHKTTHPSPAHQPLNASSSQDLGDASRWNSVDAKLASPSPRSQWDVQRVKHPVVADLSGKMVVNSDVVHIL
jgi:hypothetical protein